MFFALPMFFAMWFGLMVLGLAGIGMTIWSLVEILQAPDQAYGPPWDNGKNAWAIGVAVAFLIPFGVVVAPVVWWTQGHRALRGGYIVPRPFWAPAPTRYPYPPQPPYPPGTTQGPPPP